MPPDAPPPADEPRTAREFAANGCGSKAGRAGLLAGAARPLAWASLLAIALLSLVPGNLRPHSFLPGQAEHFLAYAGAGFLLAIGYRSTKERCLGWLGVAGAGVAFELLQHLSPGRTPRVIDAVASIGGLSVGIALGALRSRSRRAVMPPTRRCDSGG